MDSTDLRKNYPVTLQWAELWPDRFVPEIRDSKQDLIVEFLDYSIYRGRKKLRSRGGLGPYNSMMHAIAYALLDYARFLRRKRKTWQDADDELLADFRDSSYEQVRQDSRSKDELTASQTVNVKLRLIYDFYTWAEVDALLTNGKIGWSSGDIRSTLPLYKHTHNENDKRDKDAYPLCYKGIGEFSRTPAGQYWATNKDLDDIEDFFRSVHQPETAERNILFMRVADALGWRRGSINSLNIGQFSDSIINLAISSGLPTLTVTPAAQKRGRAQSFKMDYALAWEINRYIKNRYGPEVAEKSEWCHEASSLPLFTSGKGKPLKNQTWSEIFEAAFQAIGAPPGANLHSIRRKFAESILEEEITRRKRLGLSIAFEDIAEAVAEKLGHDSKLSQAAYIRVSTRPNQGTLEEVQSQTISELTAELLAQKAELARRDTTINTLVKALQKAERKTNSEHRRGRRTPKLDKVITAP